MPIESLSDHLYSTKSDSFALGVLLYYLTSRRFPWKGKSKEELVCNYELKKCNRHGIAHLAPRVKHLIQSLLEV
jgi:serine/threonine protein kinase